MASVQLQDEQAAFDLVRAVIRQAVKDTKYKRVNDTDRADAKAFLGAMSQGDVVHAKNGQQSGGSSGQR